MKALALSCSQRTEKGNTALILNPFLDGWREVGAEVESFYTKKLNINPCQGCYICWLKTPGKCFQKDDMQMLRPKLREADVWVLAMPVYYGLVPAPTKTLIDRMTLLFQPFIELRGGHWSQALREGTKYGKVVWVSSCGYWEMDNFRLVLAYVRGFREFAGAQLKPHADVMRPMMDMSEQLDDIILAAIEAGRQLARDSEMSAETLNIVSRQLMPLETYIQAYNKLFQ